MVVLALLALLKPLELLILLELLELLVGWEPAAMRRLARSGRMWVAHPFAVTDPSEALISQWEKYCKWFD